MDKIDYKKRNLIKLSLACCAFGGAILCSSCSKRVAKVNYKKCTKCRLCELVCPQRAISYQDGKIIIDKEKCNACEECVSKCIYGAISI